MMKKSELKNLSRRELIDTIMKSNDKVNRKCKPEKPKAKAEKVNYNLEEFFDDDPFPDLKPQVTNNQFDKEMNKVHHTERKINKMNESIENKYKSLQLPDYNPAIIMLRLPGHLYW